MPAFLAGPLLKYAIMALVVAALCGTIYVYHLKLDAARAQLAAITAQRDEAIAANTGLADQVTKLTADAATAKATAASLVKEVAARGAAATASTATIEEKIVHVAVPSDDVCSPSLAAALSLVCPAASANDHVATAH